MAEINLEEFERRLRAAGTSQSKVEDPLEELTRLVNVISAQAPPPAPVAPVPAVVAAPLPLGPQPEPPKPALASAALRPSFDETSEAIAVSGFEVAAPPPQPAPTPTKPQGRGAWRLKVGALVMVAAAMATGAVWLKIGGAPIGPKSPPFILAAAGPNKVAPPDEKGVESAADVGALLNKDSTTGGPVKVVANEEQPVDVNAGPKTAPPAPAATPAAAAPATIATVVASPVAPTSNTPIIAPSVEPAPPTASAFAQKKPVKTVSVRPDGTLIAVDSTPVASTPPTTPAPSPSTAAPRVEPAPTVAVEPASPTLGLPTPKSSKPTARPVVGKTDTTAPADSVNAPMRLSGAAASDKPQKLPTRLRPPEPATTDVASAAPAAGDFAVQLAAPRSEADARSAIQRFQSKYSDALGQTELGVRKASDANGDAVYRVRTAGMSKADARALCDKLKADGGDCFVARN
jgi:hypothetical protein